MSGWVCGKKAEFARKGSFASQERNRRGRQLGRVLATRYQEVVGDRIFAGNRQLNTTLELTQEQRGHCLLRVGAGGGSAPQSQLALGAGLWRAGQRLFGPAGSPVGSNGAGVGHRSPSARARGRLGDRGPDRFCPPGASGGGALSQTQWTMGSWGPDLLAF